MVPQSSLINVYTHPSSYDEIDTLEFLDEKNIKLGISHLGLIVDIFGNATPETTLGTLHVKKNSTILIIQFIFHAGSLQKKIVPVSLDCDIFKHIAEHGDISTLERKQNERILSMKYIRHNGNPLLHFVKECPRSVKNLN